MANWRRPSVILAALLGVAALVFLLGIGWGLPSNRVTPYLYGSETPWSGDELCYLAGGWDSTAGVGADVDRTPLVRGDTPILLNSSDRQRAEIIRRYLLYSYQPDEMITFRALAQMHPGEKGGLDPKLYQYGGLWVYPVGALLKLGMWLHLIAAPPAGRPALAFYLDNPDAFGRFYVVARLYALLWGIIGVWVVWWIAKRLTRDELIALACAAAYIFLPVVMNGAHEAKPHLPGLVLMLLGIAAAVKYLEAPPSGSAWRWGLTAGALCGAAFGMVLSSLAIFVVLPVMVWRRQRDSIVRRIAVLAGALGTGVLVYVITNPYVPINLVFPNSPGGEALRSNLGNSAQMYRVSARGLLDAGRLIGLGTSPWLALMGVAGALVLIIVARMPLGAGRRGANSVSASNDSGKPESRSRASASAGAVLASTPKVHMPSTTAASPAGVAWLVFSPAVAVTIQFILLAAGKPPEYARFAMLSDVALLLAAGWAASRVAAGNAIMRQLLAALIVVSALPYGLAYCRAFVRDARPLTSRLQAAAELPVTGRILLESEPAPYDCPPVNLFSRDVVLLPPGAAKHPKRYLREGDLLVYPVNVPMADSEKGPRRLPFGEPPGSLDQFTTPITWADKSFALQVGK